MFFVRAGFDENCIPPAFTLGQEILSSYPWMPGQLFKIRIHSTYSATVLPATFTMVLHLSFLKKGILSFTKERTPTLASPIAFSMPAVTSQMRGASFPWRGLSVMAFV
jgi:hypothetical protein